jgi:hypothetical protein
MLKEPPDPRDPPQAAPGGQVAVRNHVLKTNTSKFTRGLHPFPEYGDASGVKSCEVSPLFFFLIENQASGWTGGGLDWYGA